MYVTYGAIVYNYVMPLWAIVQSIAPRFCRPLEALSHETVRPRAIVNPQHQGERGDEGRYETIDLTFVRKKHLKGKEVSVTFDVT